MKTTAFSIIVLIIFTSSCTKRNPPIYYWRGTLYSGMSDTIKPNERVRLERYYKNILAGANTISEVLTEGFTDENGRFNLTYPAVKGKWPDYEDEIGLILTLPDQSPRPKLIDYYGLYYPWNINVEKDFAEKHHSRILIDVTLTSSVLPDTFYYAYDEAFFNQDNRYHYFWCIGRSFLIHAVPVQSSNFTIINKSSRVGKWNHEPARKLWLLTGTSLLDLEKSMCSTHIDSVRDGYNVYPFDPSGFPMVDTIKVIMD